MSASRSPLPGPFTHTYYPPISRLLRSVVPPFLYALTVPVGAFMILLGINAVTPAGLILWLVGSLIWLTVVAAISLATATVFYRASITLTADGIVYSKGQRTIRATWDQVESLGDRKTRPNGVVREGLILHGYPVEVDSPQRPDPYLIAPDRFIPLADFDPNWRKSRLGADLLNYAPFLFPPRYSTR